MKSDKSTKWFIRVTAPWEHIEIKYKAMREWIDFNSSAIGYHIGSKTKKPHAHIALILNTDLQKQSVDVRCKKLFDVKGSDYSSKPWDGCKKALSYLYHDKAGKVDMGIELSDEEKKEVESLVTVYNEIVTTAKAKASNRMVDYVLDAIKESGEIWSDRRIYEYMAKAIAEEKFHSVGQLRMECYLDDILLRQSKDALYIESTVDHMADKFFARYRRA